MDYKNFGYATAEDFKILKMRKLRDDYEAYLSSCVLLDLDKEFNKFGFKTEELKRSIIIDNYWDYLERLNDSEFLDECKRITELI